MLDLDFSRVFKGLLTKQLPKVANHDPAITIDELYGLQAKVSPWLGSEVARLARKCDEGRLTPEERAEYQLYVSVGDFVAVLQGKARRHLAGRSHA